MKKCVGFLVLTLSSSAFLQAESVWTGNAGVGSPQQFPGSREYFRAASNSFPIGTILEVMNPRGRASVEVTVIERLESPGVFLLMEISAAKMIGIPLDHIRPVQVTPIGSSDIGSYIPVNSGEPNNEENSDTADVPPNSQISTYPGDAKGDADSSRNEGPDALTAVPFEYGMIDNLGDFDDAGEEILNPFDVYSKTEDRALILDQTTPDLEDIPEDMPDEVGNLASIEESEGGMEDLEESKSQLLFLSPSYFRPPAGRTVVTEQTLPIEQEGDFEIPEYRIGDEGKYIQIGAYRNREIVETRIKDIQQSNPDYPLKIAITSESSDQTVYKLLVGPVKPAEIGVVLDTVRRNRFPDAFLFIR